MHTVQRPIMTFRHCPVLRARHARKKQSKLAEIRIGPDRKQACAKLAVGNTGKCFWLLMMICMVVTGVEAQPGPCEGTLSTWNLADSTINNGGTQTVYSNAWFDNIDNTNCPILLCNLVPTGSTPTGCETTGTVDILLDTMACSTLPAIGTYLYYHMTCSNGNAGVGDTITNTNINFRVIADCGNFAIMQGPQTRQITTTETFAWTNIDPVNCGFAFADLTAVTPGCHSQDARSTSAWTIDLSMVGCNAQPGDTLEYSLSGMTQSYSWFDSGTYSYTIPSSVCASSLSTKSPLTPMKIIMADMVNLDSSDWFDDNQPGQGCEINSCTITPKGTTPANCDDPSQSTIISTHTSFPLRTAQCSYPGVSPGDFMTYDFSCSNNHMTLVNPDVSIEVEADCSNAFTSNGVQKQNILLGLSGLVRQDDAFTNSDPVNCALTCTLNAVGTAGCDSNNNDGTITVNTNACAVTTGDILTYGMACTNSHNTAFAASFEATVAADCQSVLSNKPSPRKLITKGTTGTLSAEDAFNNGDTVNCLFDTCTLTPTDPARPVCHSTIDATSFGIDLTSGGACAGLASGELLEYTMVCQNNNGVIQMTNTITAEIEQPDCSTSMVALANAQTKTVLVGDQASFEFSDAFTADLGFCPLSDCSTLKTFADDLPVDNCFSYDALQFKWNINTEQCTSLSLDKTAGQAIRYTMKCFNGQQYAVFDKLYLKVDPAISLTSSITSIQSSLTFTQYEENPKMIFDHFDCQPSDSARCNTVQYSVENIAATPTTQELNLVTGPDASGTKQMKVTFYSGEVNTIVYKILATSLYANPSYSISLQASFSYNCSNDNVRIEYNRQSPDDSEQSKKLTDAFFFNMIAPSVVTLNSHAGDFIIDLTNRVKNNATSQCPITALTVRKVEDSNNQPSEYSTNFIMDNSHDSANILTISQASIISLNNPLSVYLTATNGVFTIDIPDPIISLENPNKAPEFTSSLALQKVDLNSGQDKFVINLPEIIDHELHSYIVTIQKENYLSVRDNNKIVIDINLAKSNDLNGNKIYNVILTDKYGASKTYQQMVNYLENNEPAMARFSAMSQQVSEVKEEEAVETVADDTSDSTNLQEIEQEVVGNSLEQETLDVSTAKSDLKINEFVNSPAFTAIFAESETTANIDSDIILIIPDPVPYKIRIEKFDQTGVLHLAFTEKMFDQDNGFKLEWIQQTMGITASNTVTEQNFGLEWSPQSFRSRKMVVKIEFENPIEVGQSEEGVDLLYVTFKNPDLILRTKDYFINPAYLHENSYLLNKRLKKQFKNDVQSVVLVQTGSGSLPNSLNFTAVMNLWMTQMLAMLLGAMNALQLIVFQSMMNLSYPANAQYFTKMIVDIVTFEILDPEQINSIVFDFDISHSIMDKYESVSYEDKPDEIQYLITSIQDMGFETFNPMLNLGGIFGVLVGSVLAYVIHILLKLILSGLGGSSGYEGGHSINKKCRRTRKKCRRTLRSFDRKLRGFLFYQGILVTIQESFYPLMISGLLALREPTHFIEWDDFSNKARWTRLLSTGLGIIIFMLLLWYVLVVTKITIANHFILEDEIVQSKFGLVYESLDVKSRIAMSYNFVNMTRKLLMTFIFLSMGHMSGQQIQFTLFINLLMIIYAGKAKSFILKQQNTMNLVNESLIFLCTVNLVVFTDFVLDKGMKYDIGGWSFITIVSLSILYNLFFIFRGVLNGWKLYIVKYYRLIKRWISKRFGSKDKDEIKTKYVIEPVEADIEQEEENNLNIMDLEKNDNKVSPNENKQVEIEIPVMKNLPNGMQRAITAENFSVQGQSSVKPNQFVEEFSFDQPYQLQVDESRVQMPKQINSPKALPSLQKELDVFEKNEDLFEDKLVRSFKLRRQLAMSKVRVKYAEEGFGFSPEIIKGLYEEEVSRLMFDYLVYSKLIKKFFTVYFPFFCEKTNFDKEVMYEKKHQPRLLKEYGKAVKKNFAGDLFEDQPGIKPMKLIKYKNVTKNMLDESNKLLLELKDNLRILQPYMFFRVDYDITISGKEEKSSLLAMIKDPKLRSLLRKSRPKRQAIFEEIGSLENYYIKMNSLQDQEIVLLEQECLRVMKISGMWGVSQEKAFQTEMTSMLLKVIDDEVCQTKNDVKVKKGSDLL